MVLAVDNPYGFTFLHPSGEGINHKCNELTQVLADMNTLGAKWLRFQLPWRRIEASQGVYTLGGLDETVAACNAAGIAIQYTIQGTPTFWATRACSCDPTQFFADVTGTQNFVTVLASRYNGVFNVPGFGPLFMNSIEIGNEDYDLFGVTQCCRDLGGQYLAPVMVACVPVINALSPNCLVGPAALLTQSATHDINWIGQLFAGGAAPYLNYINIHFYKSGGNPPTNGNSIQILQAAIRQALANANYGELTTWITETGWPTNATGHNAGDVVTYNTQWSYFLQMLEFGRNSGNQVSHIFWFTIGKNDGDSITQGGAIDGSFETYVPAFWNLQNYIDYYPQWTQTGASVMPADFFAEPNAQATISGGLTVISNVLTNDSGNLTVNNNIVGSGNLTVASLATLGQVAGGVKNGGAVSLAATITNNGTIALGTFRNVRVQATAACTSAALPTGTVDGQDLNLINVGGTAITISTNVTPATTLAVSGAASFSWDAGSTLWYHRT